MPNPALIHAYAIIINDYIRVFILNVLHTVHNNIVTTLFDEKQCDIILS